MSIDICLLVFTDGRGPLLQRTLESAREHVSGPITARAIVDDSGEPVYAAWLDERYGDDYLIVHHPERRGFCRAIQTGWRLIPPYTNYVFHLEDDFTFNRQVNLVDMAAVLAGHPYLLQLVLKRQPWNEQEKAAGGIVEMWPGEYQQESDVHGSWLEHRLFWSTNPSLYRTAVTELGWPDPPGCEGKFTTKRLRNSEARFAFWGDRDDEPWVTHIGDERAGSGY